MRLGERGCEEQDDHTGDRDRELQHALHLEWIHIRARTLQGSNVATKFTPAHVGRRLGGGIELQRSLRELPIEQQVV